MNTQPNVPVLRPLAPRETPESSRTTGCTFQPMVLPIPSFVAQQATFMSSSTSNVTNILPKAQQPIGSGSEVPAYQTTSSLDQSYAEQTASNKQLLRAGKWIPEEEEYAQLLISLFEGGLVTDCENGATLRSYLSQKLQCAPMRISKKFAGKGIGKMIYACKYTVGSSKQLQLQLQSTELKDKVEKTEQKFLDAIIPSSGFIPVSFAFTYYLLASK